MKSRIFCSEGRAPWARGLSTLIMFGVSLAALTTVAAPLAAASNGEVVSFRDCLVNGGTISVPSGVPITIGGIGFAQGTYGLAHDFLLKQRTTLTISNSTSSAFDLSHEWGTPQQVDNLWVTRLPDTDVGVVLQPGESFLATYDITLARRVLVAYPPVTSSGYNGPYLITEEGPLSCAVIAS